MKKASIYILTAFIMLGTFACMPKPDADENVAASADSTVTLQPVKTVALKSQLIKRTVKTTASLVAEEETYLAPAISGMIRSVNVEVDDKVKKGQILVRMDKSQLSQTRVQYENLKKDLERMDTLIQYGSVTQQAYDQLKTQVNVTKVMMASLEENTVLRAPYNGVITGKYFNDGELFSPAPNTPSGKAAIVSIVKMDILKVFINLSEGYLPLVKKGQIATVETEVYSDTLFQAIVHRIYPTINAATRTFTVELQMDNKDYDLRPGMYSTVKLEMGDREAMLVPAIAVLKQTGTNNRFIFLHRDGKCIKKSVELGERLDDQLELIPNGVQPGDELIYAGHVNLMDGDEVKVIVD